MNVPIPVAGEAPYDIVVAAGRPPNDRFDTARAIGQPAATLEPIAGPRPGRRL